MLHYLWSCLGHVILSHAILCCVKSILLLVKDAVQETEVDKNTGCDVYGWLHEVCSITLLSTPVVLGDQIDKTLFTLKLKANNNILKQYHQGRAANCEMWVFGICDTSHSPALGFMQVVAQQDAATLLPIVQNHVTPGSVVWSDQ